MPLRAASVWLALAVALLSSLLSSGLPRTTTLGSAFNPATTAVALQPSRPQPRMLADQLRRDDDPAGGQGATVSQLPATVPPAVRSFGGARAPAPASALRPVAPPSGLNGSPRGPPST